MTLRPVALVVLLGMISGLAALERSPAPEARLALLTPEAADAIRGGQFCYTPCVSQNQCPGGVNDDCADHICPGGMGPCPDNLADGILFSSKKWCDGCSVEQTGQQMCRPAGFIFYCEYDVNCQGPCEFKRNAFRCSRVGVPQGTGDAHDDYDATGPLCFDP